MRLKKLGCMPDAEVDVLPPQDFRQMILDTTRKNLSKAHDKHERSYNVRSREVRFRPGQEVNRRNFAQSEFKNNFNAKLAPKFIKCRVLRKVGSSLYEL